MVTYVQPIAQHTAHAERMLLRGEDSGWYLWTGRSDMPREDSIAPIDLPLATWILTHPTMQLLPEPRCWVHLDDLPTESTPSHRSKKG